MSRRKLGEQSIRKLQKVGNGSVSVTLPIELVRGLRWREKQKVTIRRKGKRLIIEDWKK